MFFLVVNEEAQIAKEVCVQAGIDKGLFIQDTEGFLVKDIFKMFKLWMK